MNVLLFLGSGVSLDSNMPSTSEISEAIFEQRWFHHSDGSFYTKGAENELEYVIPATCVQAFLRILRQEVGDYFLRRQEPGPSYEDLYYFCHQVASELAGETYDPAALAMSRNLQRQSTHLLFPADRAHPLREEVSFRQLVETAMRFIESVVARCLSRAQMPVKLGVISELARSAAVAHLDICTLNHDVLVESELASHGIQWTDGFGKPDGDYRWLDLQTFDQPGKVCLLKLHGSIDWWQTKYSRDRVAIRRFAILPRAPHPFDLRDQSGKHHFEMTSIPEILIGTHNKLHDYLFGLYSELRLRFMRALRQCDVVVMSGYGWNDRGINGTFSQWLLESAEHRLVLLHERPDEIMNSRSFMWHRFEELVENKQLILERQWLGGTKGERLLQLIQDARRAEQVAGTSSVVESNLEVSLKTVTAEELFG